MISDSDEVEEWLYNKIIYDKLNDKEIPQYLWGTQSEVTFDINLKEIIEERCEDGYEDMITYLDMNSIDLFKAQKYLNKWYKEQGNRINSYSEDYSKAILLDDLIKEIRLNNK